MLPLLICLWIISNSRSYCLTWGKKKKERDPKRKENKPPAGFKPVQRVLLVVLDATGRGRLGFAFLLSYGFERMGTKSGPQYSQLPSLQPRSSMNRHQTLSLWALSVSQSQALSPRQAGHMWFCSAFSLYACAAEITLRVSQPLLESSLQSSCPPS